MKGKAPELRIGISNPQLEKNKPTHSDTAAEGLGAAAG